MDDLDQKILAALAADSSTSTSRLARRFKVARSTVQARIERLENTGVIAAYTIKLGDAGLARRIRATVLARAAGRSAAPIIQRLRAIPETEAVHTTTGAYDLIIQIAAATTEDLDQVLEQIAAIPGLTDMQGMVHLSTKFDRSV